MANFEYKFVEVRVDNPRKGLRSEKGTKQCYEEAAEKINAITQYGGWRVHPLSSWGFRDNDLVGHIMLERETL